ncbi:MAG: NnrS family protein [Nitrosospira sp.]
MIDHTSNWHHLSVAPHRGMFLAGALEGVLTLLWWVADLAGRYGVAGTTSAWSIAPIWAHAFLMIYGFFSFFILGFLFTTFPSWMNGEKIQPRHFTASSLLMAGGIVLFYLGLAAGKLIVAAGVAMLLAGFSIAVYALLRVLFRVKNQDRRHAIAASVALVCGWLGIAAYLLWLLTENASLLDFSRSAGIWFFLLPIVMTVSHRMIPFFSSRVLENYVLIRPYWILWLMLACSAGHGILQLWEPAFSYLWLFDLPLAASAVYLSFNWGLLRSFRVHLLAVLHIAFAWLGLSMLLYGTQSLVFLLSGGKLLIFGLAPLHALAIGYFASMVLGMASRVTLGHSGHPLVLDKLSWLLFIGFQAATLFRILPDILPAAISMAPGFYLLAGLTWLICFTLWAGRYAPLYWRPRVDGKPG